MTIVKVFCQLETWNYMETFGTFHEVITKTLIPLQS